jgi:hypothetical protein
MGTFQKIFKFLGSLPLYASARACAIIMNARVAFEPFKELNCNVSFSRALRAYVKVVYEHI